MPEESDSSFVRAPIREDHVDGTCPYCGQATLVMRSLPLDLPYFGDALQTTVLCTSCSYRNADLILTKEGEPVRYELQVHVQGDLAARVVRSASGTIRVPELGVAVEPGPRAEAFVSNVEGVLHRIRAIVGFMVRHADSEASRRKAEKRLAAVDSMIAGTEGLTLVLEDPTGNSAILHERATKTTLTDAQARRLKRAAPEFRVER